MRKLSVLFCLVQVWIASGLTLAAADPCGVPTNAVAYYVIHGSNSFAELTLSGVPAGWGISNGSYKAWCINSALPIDLITSYTGRLYACNDPNLPGTYTNISWPKLNYLINHKSGTVDEVQNALWALLGQEVEEPFTSNSVAMLNAANQFGAGFAPLPGQPQCVVVAPLTSVQPLVLEYTCARDMLFLSNPLKVSATVFEFKLHGRTGTNYLLRYTTNMTQWTFLRNVVATNTVITVRDTNQGGLFRSYRAETQ